MRKSLLAALAALVLFCASARAGDSVSFMSFTVAEEGNRAFVEQLLADFTAQSGPAVEAIPTAWGDILKNVMLRQRSRTLPDVVQLSERWLNTVAVLPESVDLNTVFGKEELEKRFGPAMLGMGLTVDGRQVTLPIVTGSFNMVANVEVLRQAGVNELPKSYAELKTALAAVRDKDPLAVPFGFCTKNPASVAQDYVYFVRAFGGQVIGDNGEVLIGSDANKQALAELVAMTKDRLIAPEMDRPDSRRMFGQDKMAFYVDAVQARSFARGFSGIGEAFDSHIMPMSFPPVKSGDAPKSIQWGHSLVAFNADVTDADSPSRKFLAFMMSDEAQVGYAKQLSALPTTLSARNNPEIQNDAYLAAWAAGEGTPVANDVSIWPNAVDLTNILSEGVQAALLGQMTVDEAIADMEARMTASMERAK